MSRSRYRRAVVAMALALGLCLLLAVWLSSPDRDSLSTLQKMIVENGSCSVSTVVADCVIQADTAKIEDDTLVIERNAETGDNSLVLVNIGADSISARSVSIRFITSPKDMLELKFHKPKPVGLGRMLNNTSGRPQDVSLMTLRLDRHWTLRQRFHHFRQKIRRAIK